jgi:hypothetical protein
MTTERKLEILDSLDWASLVTKHYFAASDTLGSEHKDIESQSYKDEMMLCNHLFEMAATALINLAVLSNKITVDESLTLIKRYDKACVLCDQVRQYLHRTKGIIIVEDSNST